MILLAGIFGLSGVLLGAFGAHALKAALALEANQLDTAATQIDQALKVNPRSLDAHALKAALLYLQDKDFEPEVAATLEISPRYGGIFNTLSRYATITRRTKVGGAVRWGVRFTTLDQTTRQVLRDYIEG